MTPTYVKLTRKELYDLVWSQSLRSLSKKYNISDTGLRKICISMGIPVPKAGHWAKLQHGKSVLTKSLPSNFSGKQAATLEVRDEQSKNRLIQLESLQQEIQSSPSSSDLIVPEKLTSPDPLIATTKDNLAKNKDGHRQKGDIIHLDPLDIRVTQKNVSRSLRFLDTLIKALRKRGHDIACEKDNTNVIIGHERIHISLKEKLSRDVTISGRYPAHVSVPTGDLSFKIEAGYIRREMSDGREKLEQKLPSIIAKLEVEGARLKEETIKREKEKAEREERERIEREHKERRQKALCHFSDLYYKSQQWRKVALIRDYINDVETKARSNSNLTEELIEWISSARKKADWFDPALNITDELLNEEDKKRLLESFESSSNSNNNAYGYFSMPRDNNWRKPWYSR
jgi:hypothetical protein